MTTKGIMIVMLGLLAAAGIVLHGVKLIEDFIIFILIEVGCMVFMVINLVELRKLHGEFFKKNIAEAEELYKGRQIQNALKKFDEAARHNPKALEVFLGRAQCRKVLMQYDLALKECRRASELHPDAFQPYYNAGVIQLQMDKPNDAMVSFMKTAAKNPDFVEAYFFMGQIKEKLSEWREALEYYQKYVDKNGPMKDSVMNSINDIKKKLGIDEPEKPVVVETLSEEEVVSAEVIEQPVADVQQDHEDETEERIAEEVKAHVDLLIAEQEKLEEEIVAAAKQEAEEELLAAKEQVNATVAQSGTGIEAVTPEITIVSITADNAGIQESPGIQEQPISVLTPAVGQGAVDEPEKTEIQN